MSGAYHREPYSPDLNTVPVYPFETLTAYQALAPIEKASDLFRLLGIAALFPFWTLIAYCPRHGKIDIRIEADGRPDPATHFVECRMCRTDGTVRRFRAESVE